MGLLLVLFTRTSRGVLRVLVVSACTLREQTCRHGILITTNSGVLRVFVGSACTLQEKTYLPGMLIVVNARLPSRPSSAAHVLT